MMRVAIALASLLSAVSAPAAVMVTPERLELKVGERAELRATYVSWGTAGALLEFVSCDPSIVAAEGTLVVPPGSHGASTTVAVHAVGPGTAGVCTTSGARVASVDVTCGPVRAPEPLAPRLSTRAGAAVTLTVVSPLLPNTVYSWYLGRAGDTTAPLGGSGPDLRFTPAAAGEHHVWVSVATPCSTGTAAFVVEAAGPRRRAVR